MPKRMGWAILFSTLALDAAHASRPLDISHPEPIQFKPGETCWDYVGPAEDFAGVFNSGSTLVVSSTGDSMSASRELTWHTTIERQISVSQGPRIWNLEEGTKRFVVPQTGKYTFSIGPNAVRGFTGKFVICDLGAGWIGP